MAADAAHQVIEGVDVEDTVNVLARHGKDDQILASYAFNQHQSPNELTVTVVGRSGTARFENHNCRWRLMKNPDDPWQDFNFGPLERDELFSRQANGFLDAVEGKCAPACSLSEGAATLRVNRAVLASADERKWQDTRA